MSKNRQDLELKPRRAPEQRRSAATVDAILEAAARVLEARGAPGYNTNEIAGVAGVSIGSLYQYFPNKDAITGALIHRELLALLTAITAIPVTSSWTERMRWLIQIAVDQQLGQPNLSRLLDREEGRLPLRDGLHEIHSRLVTAVQDIVQAVPTDVGGRHGEVTGDVIAIIRGMVDAAGERDERDAPPLVERVQRAVFGYLGYLTDIEGIPAIDRRVRAPQRPVANDSPSRR